MFPVPYNTEMKLHASAAVGYSIFQTVVNIAY